jgi:hypothetical protein
MAGVSREGVEDSAERVRQRCVLLWGGVRPEGEPAEQTKGRGTTVGAVPVAVFQPGDAMAVCAQCPGREALASRNDGAYGRFQGREKSEACDAEAGRGALEKGVVRVVVASFTDWADLVPVAVLVAGRTAVAPVGEGTVGSGLGPCAACGEVVVVVVVDVLTVTAAVVVGVAAAVVTFVVVVVGGGGRVVESPGG